MKKPLKILLIVLAVIAGLFLILFLGATIENMDLWNRESFKDAKLKKYTYSTGGDMRGSSYSLTVAEYDDSHAIVSTCKKGWHADVPHVEEYLVDKQILSDLEEVIREYNMQKWDGKTFTKMFVADGASKSYSFSFGDTLYYSFSSQIFPAQYSSKLEKLDEVINRYNDRSKKLPALVYPQMSEEEIGKYKSSLSENGLVNVEIESYIMGRMEFLITNGTTEHVMIPTGYYMIFNQDSEEPLKAIDGGYEGSFDLYPGSCFEMDLGETLRLEPGKYILVIGKDRESGISCEFEID